MKVLLVNKFYYPFGGSETYLFSLKKILEAKGHTTIPFAMKHPRNLPTPFSQFFAEEVDYRNRGILHGISAAARVVYSGDARRKMEELLENHPPDVAHLNIFQHQLSPSVIPPLKKRKIPVIYTVHDLKPICPNYKMYVRGKTCESCRGGRFYHCLLNRCTKNSLLGSLVNTIEMYAHRWLKFYNLVDRFITPSRFYREKLASFGFPQEKITCIPNFILLEEYPPGEEGEGYFVYFGRLVEEKGLVTLLKAMKKVAGGELRIVGEGPLRGELESYARKERLDHVRFLGFRRGRDLQAIVSRSLFSVLPSEWYENGPLSILESFVLGKPVVGSRMGGIPEYIDDGVNGLLFRPGDPEDLSEKLNALLGNRGRIAEMGRAARRKVEDQYSAEDYYGKIVKIYEEFQK